MGSAQGDYHQQVNQALSQANLPKSTLAQGVNNYLSSNYSIPLNGLQNAGQLGNAFPGLFSGFGTPGQVFNGSGSGQTGQTGTPAFTMPPQNGLSDGTTPSIPNNPLRFPNIGTNGVSPQQNQMAGLGNFNLSLSTANNPYYGAGNPNATDQYAQRGLKSGLSFTGSSGNVLTNPDQNAPGGGYINVNGTPMRIMGTSAAGNPNGPQIGKDTYLLQGANGNQVNGPIIGDEYSQFMNAVNSINPSANGNVPGSTSAFRLNDIQSGGDNGGGPQITLPQGSPTDPSNSGSSPPPSNTPPTNPPSGNPSNPQNPQNPVGSDPISQLLNSLLGSQNNQNGQNITSGFTTNNQIQPSTSLFPAIQQANPNLNLQNPNNSAISTLLQQLQAPSVNSYNPSANILQSQGANQQFSGAQGLQTNFPSPQNSDYYNALSQTLNNQVNNSRNTLNAQFGSGGGSSRGTPAAFANAQFDAQVLPQLAATLGQAQQQDIGNQLQSQNQSNQATLQNYLGTIGANQNQLGLLSGLAGQAGNLNLGQGQLGSSNILNTAGLNSQNANLALQNQLGFQTNQNSLLNNLSQFNSGQNNQITQQYMSMLQQANQQQIQNQFGGLQNLAQIIASLSQSGTPSGGANVNLGTNSQSATQQLLGAL